MSVTLFVLFALVLLIFWLHDCAALTADIRWDLERCEQKQAEVEPETGKRLLLVKGRTVLEADGKAAECSWSGESGDIGLGKRLSGNMTEEKKYNKPGKYLYINRLLRNKNGN